jgi:hypothetical protein
VFGLGDGIEIIGPKSAREGMKQQIEAVGAGYRKP